ncbi:MAG TPA: alpha/beta fold hydrolase [Patescibacteria group bacterium]|nr:alpha/beta fold hydrolase [Patescibacteria group bacterium]
MQNVFIFHGTEGHPKENWFPWLKGELEAKGCKVFVPQFPSPPFVPAKITEWFEVLKEYEMFVDENTIFVGHSLGGLFLLRVLERLNQPCKAAVFVGTPIGIQPLVNYDRDNAFSEFTFNWAAIRPKSKYFAVFHSDNDPYVGLENGEQLAKHLGTGLHFIPNAGHFNSKAGYTTFFQLLEKLEKYLSF